MGYGPLRRIGLLVPSSNTTMEPEFYRMAPGGVSVHTARMRLEEVTPEGLVEMAEDAGRGAGLLATAEVDVIVYGCTTGSLVGGVEWEERLVGRIERETRIPTLSTSRAVVEALRALDVGRVAVATPYTDRLNRLEAAFLESHGIEVSAIRGLGLVRNLSIGRTGGAAVEELVGAVAGESEAVFISCTNLPTMDLIEPLEDRLRRPVVTSNQASLWAALRGCGIGPVEGYGSLLRSHL
ncbi:MAG: aspartate/glutamate racemase family protein [Candidatus Bathyarchaeia archaeon]